MTKTSRKWRDKKIKKIRVYKKIHNSILGLVTSVMAVFFLLSILSIDNLNMYVLLMFVVSAIWLNLFISANGLDQVEEGDE